jgi:large subunit ribosomal protein L29
MKMSEITKMDVGSIKTKVEELKKDLFNLRFNIHTTGLEKPHQIKVAQKTIARLLTQLNVLKASK